nr:hypothetical protein [Tanacetum cinerariifolium]GEY61207.1 hypothetical protein [Tanacetum cinerariifolium]
MGDKVINTIPVKEINEFIKSGVDDLVPIPRESEVASYSNVECDMPINTPLPITDEFEDISSLYPPKSSSLNPKPLGNPDSVSRSLDTSDLILEELATEIGLHNSTQTKIDDGYYDSEGEILFLEHLLIEETSSNPTPAVLPKESFLFVTPPLASKQFSLREVKIFDPFSP